MSIITEVETDLKSVLMSIKPKWCELIASGKKTIEVRKTRPKCDTPFKCYIYCTKPKMITKYVFKPEDYPEDMRPEKPVFCKQPDASSPFCSAVNGNGKVIGEFVCHTIISIKVEYSNPNSHIADKEFPFTGLTDREIMGYLGNGKTGYGWRISDLVIYDKPKDLDDFMAFGKTHCDQKNCDNCLYMGVEGVCDVKDIGQPIIRPPQSWCYVEESEQ